MRTCLKAHQAATCAPVTGGSYLYGRHLRSYIILYGCTWRTLNVYSEFLKISSVNTMHLFFWSPATVLCSYSAHQIPAVNYR